MFDVARYGCHKCYIIIYYIMYFILSLSVYLFNVNILNIVLLLMMVMVNGVVHSNFKCLFLPTTVHFEFLDFFFVKIRLQNLKIKNYWEIEERHDVIVNLPKESNEYRITICISTTIHSSISVSLFHVPHFIFYVVTQSIVLIPWILYHYSQPFSLIKYEKTMTRSYRMLNT